MVLSHELTNLAHLHDFNKLKKEVAAGSISAGEFADAKLRYEAEGVLNKIIVAAESGLRHVNPRQQDINDAADMLHDDPLIIDQLREIIKESMNTAARKDGRKLYDLYFEEGMRRREYKIMHPNEN